LGIGPHSSNVVLFVVVSHDVLCIGLVLLHLKENCENFSKILWLSRNCENCDNFSYNFMLSVLRNVAVVLWFVGYTGSCAVL